MSLAKPLVVRVLCLSLGVLLMAEHAASQ